MLRECKAVPVTSFTFSKWSEDVVPTVAFNFRKVRKGNVVLKIWDVAGTRSARQVMSYRLSRFGGCPGQPKFRSMWERYCHGVDAVVYDDDGTFVCYNL